ncbi:GGDEF-domain containing protein, partial [Streptomyces sp. NPDC005904]
MEPTESAAPYSPLRARRWCAPATWLRGRRTVPAADPGLASGPGCGALSTAIEPRERAWTSPTSGCGTESAVAMAGGPTEQDPRDPWPLLPLLVLAAAALLLGTGFFQALTGRHTLFPAGATGWSLAVLTGLIVGHLVALGRDRWWGGTGSGGALTVAVLLLYGWVPAGLVSLTVVVLVG